MTVALILADIADALTAILPDWEVYVLTTIVLGLSVGVLRAFIRRRV